jgi:hypothetical protein
VGVKTKVYDLGNGLVEFMAIGTAVKKIAGAQTNSDALPPQAIIQDRDTFVDSTQNLNLNMRSAASARRTQGGPVAIIFAILFIMFYMMNFFLHR